MVRTHRNHVNRPFRYYYNHLALQSSVSVVIGNRYVEGVHSVCYIRDYKTQCEQRSFFQAKKPCIEINGFFACIHQVQWV